MHPHSSLLGRHWQVLRPFNVWSLGANSLPGTSPPPILASFSTTKVSAFRCLFQPPLSFVCRGNWRDVTRWGDPESRCSNNELPWELIVINLEFPSEPQRGLGQRADCEVLLSCFRHPQDAPFFIEFVTILLLIYVLVFWPCGMWDLSSQPDIEPTSLALEGKALTTELPKKFQW